MERGKARSNDANIVSVLIGETSLHLASVSSARVPIVVVADGKNAAYSTQEDKEELNA